MSRLNSVIIRLLFIGLIGLEVCMCLTCLWTLIPWDYSVSKVWKFADRFNGLVWIPYIVGLGGMLLLNFFVKRFQWKTLAMPKAVASMHGVFSFIIFIIRFDDGFY